MNPAEKHAWRTRLWAWQSRYSSYLFVAPFVILFLIFFLYPLGRSLMLGFHKTLGPGQTKFVGFENYRFLLTDRFFWLAMGNTIAFTIGYLLFQIPAALGLAIFLNSPRVRAKSVFRFAFFSTHLTGSVFVAVLFAQLLSPKTIGVNVMSRPEFTLPLVLVASLWLSVGFAMMYFLAALQAIDRDLYEAAEVDGAGPWSQFWHVTLPGIRPVLMAMILIGTIGALQLFELPYVLYQQSAGPLSSGLTVVMYLFFTGWAQGDLGYASAIGWALVLLIVVIVLLQGWVSRRLSR